MNTRMITDDEQRLLMRGLAKLGEQEADQLYGRLHPTDGKRLILVDLRDERLDQSKEVPG